MIKHGNLDLSLTLSLEIENDFSLFGFTNHGFNKAYHVQRL